MLTLKVNEDELARLRCVEHAAKRFLEAFQRNARVAELTAMRGEFEALKKAFTQGSPFNGTG